MLDVSLASGLFPTSLPSAHTRFFGFSVRFSSLVTLLFVLTFPGPGWLADELLSTED